MKPLFNNQSFPARPITSPETGRSRWSRQRRTTLTDPNTIEGSGARMLAAKSPRETLSANAGVRISVAPSAAFPVRFTGGQRGVSGRDRAKPRREPERSCQVAASAGGRRGAAEERARVSASVPFFPGLPPLGHQGRVIAGSWPEGLFCSATAVCPGVVATSLRVTYATQTLRASVKGNCVPLIKNTGVFS
jgi:hypothetical protein